MFETHAFTRHARERTAARSIPPLVADMILEFGESIDAGDGARKYALSRQSIREVRRYAGPRFADEMNRFRARNAYVVATTDRVITAAYSAKPLFR
jgi:hypothetical protein